MRQRSPIAPHLRRATASAVCTLALLSVARAVNAQADLAASAAPQTGTDVLQRMHDAYANTWYHTLRFVQKTTQHRPDGSAVVATWYESLRQTDAGVTQLRIDIGDLTVGNGVLYTADSTWNVKAGVMSAARAGGNEFLPLIEGVYLQPVRQTVAQLAQTHVDMSRVGTGSWLGRPAWIVGATSAADSSAPQFWIDRERNVVVRMILAVAPAAPRLDIQLGDYVSIAGGWLATKVSMFENGKPRQTEDYADWKVNVPLSDALFAAATWKTAPHWANR